MENYEISIALSKRKLNTLLLGCVLFGVAGIWFVSSPETFARVPFLNPALTVAIGVVAIVFFGFGLFYYLKKRNDPSPGLIINEQGIFDNCSGVSAGLIPWEDITGTEVLTMHKQSFLQIHVSTPEKYINRQQSGLKKMLMKANMSSYGTPINLISNSLDCSFGELINAIETGLKTYKKL